MNKNILCSVSLFILLFSSLNVSAQLAAFTLNVTSTPQTCLGNGSLNFTLTGKTTGSSMGYQVFLLPNTTVPVATVSTPVASNLVAGNYKIVATQTLGNLSNTATANAVIANQVVPLVYFLTTKPSKCNNDGEIKANITSGTAVTYEIISGPETAPPQASNVFTGLPGGQYQVRVYDNCGDAVVMGIEVIQQQSSMVIGNLSNELLYPTVASCTTVNVSNIYGVAGTDVIFWPLTLQYTVFPPGGGAPVIITTVVNQPANEETFYQALAEIPFYYDQTYHYDLKITDACGHVFTENMNVIHEAQDWSVMPGYDPCLTNSFKLTLRNFIISPVTVTFTSAPAGFNPAEYNPSHPLHNGSEIIYSKPGATLPAGSYTIQITDACGRSSSLNIISQPNDLIVAFPIEGDCGSGGIQVSMGGKEAVVIEFTSAPAGYPVALPQNLSGFLADMGDYKIPNLPAGNYIVHVIDECGNEYFEDVTVEAVTITPPTVFQLPGCIAGEGSIRINGGESKIISSVIQQAPAAFPETLPFDVSANIVNGVFNMNSLPEGQYKFALVTECGPTEITIIVKGYKVNSNNYTVAPGCGAFDLTLNHTSNAGNSQAYWLQEFNEAENIWEHPFTGNNYTEGTPLTNANAVTVNNNASNLSLPYSGKFRVVKVFFTYTSGSPQLTRCTEVIAEFNFTDGPQITGAYSFPCANGTADVVVAAAGVPPLQYRITTKNGNGFIVNNGNSALFTALEPAVYNFEVTDICGNIRNILFDLNALDPMVITAQGFCEGQESLLYVPDFPFLIYEWSRQDSPGTVLSTASKLLFPSFDPADADTYIVKITTLNPGSCIDLVLEYDLSPNALPNAGADNTIALCNDGQDIDLTQHLAAIHDNGGVWQDTGGTGAVNGSILTTGGLNPGTYQFKYSVTSICGVTDEALITLEFKDQPQKPSVDEVAPVCEGSNIQFTAATVPGAIYQWTGPNGFASDLQNPLLENIVLASAGSYSLIVTVEGKDCSSLPATVNVNVNAIPQFTIEGNTALCNGQTSILAVVPANFEGNEVSYTWYHEEEIIAGVTDGNVEIQETGTYTVVVNNNDCSAGREITVNPNNAAFEVIVDSGCINYSYMLWVVNIEDFPGAIITWTGPDGFNFTGPKADITNFPTGNYSVTVTGAEGCTAEAILPITNTSCIIPKGVSPNGDEKNDFFDLSNLDVREVKIFNRYGLEVYESKNYKNEWYGQSDKGTLPSATYYYVITLSAGKKATGWVYLQREIK